MQSLTDTSSGSTPMPAGSPQRAQASRRAADVLLREHPDAAVFTQLTDGKIVAPPDSLGLDGYPVLATDGRTGVDLAVAEDRMTLVNAWMRLKREAVAEATARLRSDPGQWRVVRMLDLRATHGVVLSIVWPTDEAASELVDAPERPAASTTPRFCSRMQDEEGNVVDCDEAYLQMFGYSTDQVIGRPTFEMVHPEDQARVIEGWIATVATGRVQMFRIRMRRADGSWLWVDTTLHNFLQDERNPHVLAECIDVSAEMAAQEALEDREELLRRLIEEMPDGLLQLDGERNVVYHNARLEQILHVPSGPGGGETRCGSLDALLAMLTDDARAALDAVVDRTLHGAGENIEVEATTRTGEQRHLLMKVRPLQRQSGMVTGAIVSVQDVTDSARARRELEKRATFDALTGAHNRSSIIAALARELEESSDTAVLYIDLDSFKSVNDTLGHAAGDRALVHVVERVKAALRASDELGRLGGDEFLVLLRNVARVEVAMDAAERICDALRGRCELGGESLQLRASVGAACAGDSPVTAQQLIERADAAMYRSKQQRRGAPVLAPAA
jgi:diguanylate cyclase (GGDEF)-like protein/PAS domain S-box-containing protein